MTKLKSPTYPLFPIDPMCSLWCVSDTLYGEDVCSWTGAEKPVFGNINIDGVLKRFMGTKGADEVFPQIDVEVTMTSTKFTFQDENVRMYLTFTTPAMALTPELPLTFIDVTVESVDGKEHEIQILFDFSEKLTYTKQRKWTMGGVLPFAEGKVGYIGRFYQFPLWFAGDKKESEWGWYYLAGSADILLSSVPAMRKYFRSLELKEKDNYHKLLAAHKRERISPETPMKFFITFAFDDIYSFEYFGDYCKGGWKTDYYDLVNALKDAVARHDSILESCRQFDEKTVEECAEFGEEYLDALAMTYRMIAASGKEGLRGGEKIFASKAQATGGYACQLEQLYRAAPYYLYYRLDWMKNGLSPLFDFARMRCWRYDFAPADAGLYPFLTGQAEGLKTGYIKTTRKLLRWHPYQHFKIKIYKDDEQTPFLNCARALILTYAYFLETYDYQFVRENADLLSKWGDYLMEKWQDERDGDDCNATMRRILGIACWGKLLGEIQPGEGQKYLDKAKEAAIQLETVANIGEYTLYHVKERRSWSLKEDLIWDTALGLNLFSAELREREYAYYEKQWHKYGVPGHSETEKTTADGLMWAMTAGDPVEGPMLAAHAISLAAEKAQGNGIPVKFDAVTGEGEGYYATAIAGIWMPLYLKKRREKSN